MISHLCRIQKKAELIEPEYIVIARDLRWRHGGKWGDVDQRIQISSYE